ncbi:hypothetical protein EHH44_01110 [Mycolicibacter terrae]|uniref:Uncharacterized protein n=1 Tax=Mycolicibacter terrae TaxID=1788 RepID=A0ACD2ETT9_9MYCO|nr:hypothetical protein [Mycolicibacter terrae]RRR48662.1 hypothetical protein EHH44_01110 [Mycolicibacter terrae]
MEQLTTLDFGFVEAEDSDRRISLAIGGLITGGYRIATAGRHDQHPRPANPWRTVGKHLETAPTSG